MMNDNHQGVRGGPPTPRAVRTHDHVRKSLSDMILAWPHDAAPDARSGGSLDSCCMVQSDERHTWQHRNSWVP